MRPGRSILLAMVAAAALSAPAYSLEPENAGHALRVTSAAGAGSIELAADSTPDPMTADALGRGLPASGATAEIPAAGNDTDPPDGAPPPDLGAVAEPASAADPSPDQQQTTEQQTPELQTPELQTPELQTEDDPQAQLPPHVYSLQDFVNQGIDDSPLGMELREDCTKFDTHEKVCGLAVLEVRNGSPADKAGIKRYTALTHDLLDGASVAAALVFPPAIVAVAVIDQSGIGETFDLVIGVDGRRVRHILDFQDLTANVRPGDTVYLTIVREGRRVQLPVQVPAGPIAFRN